MKNTTHEANKPCTTNTVASFMGCPIEEKKKFHASSCALLISVGNINHETSRFDAAPSSVYWKDLNGRYLGCNKTLLELVSIASKEEVIGKTDYDLAWKDQAALLEAHDKMVIEQGKLVTYESFIDQHNKTRFFLTNKMRMVDKDSNIIGTFGISIEITDQKEAEQLRLQNEKLELINQSHQLIANEHSQFRKIVGQMVHDLGTPLASLDLHVSSCNEIPEDTRVNIRAILADIASIANGVLQHYEFKLGKSNKQLTTTASPLMLSCTLMQIVSEHKKHYKHLGIELVYEPQKDHAFLLIQVAAIAFKRALSNIINNAADALQGRANATIRLTLNIENDNCTAISSIESSQKVVISITDNGQGMDAEIANKILAGQTVSANKKQGHGIGMSQVNDMLKANGGTLSLSSVVTQGTVVRLTLPLAPSPLWLAKELNLLKIKTIIILDDDKAIHNAWSSRLHNEVPTIVLKHFTQASLALEFIHSLSVKEKTTSFLLTDYELLGQSLTGLEVITQSSLPAILVTSHYHDSELQQAVIAASITMIPKQLAAYVAIIHNTQKETIHNDESHNSSAQENNTGSELITNFQEPVTHQQARITVDLVLLDDHEQLSAILINLLAKHNKQVAYYSSAQDLMKEASKYHLDTIFLLDYDLPCTSGLNIAKELYALGYTKLYMFSGGDLKEGSMPDYIQFICISLD